VPWHGLTQHGLRSAAVFSANQNVREISSRFARGPVAGAERGFFRCNHTRFDNSQRVANDGLITSKFDDPGEFRNS